MQKGFFRHRWMPIWLSLPQLVIMLLFFYLPVYLAFFWAFHLEQPFGGGSRFVGWQNFERVLSSGEFWHSLWLSLLYMGLETGLSLLVALLLALAADRMLRLSPLMRNLALWPKAFAVASVGVVFLFILDPFQGVLAPLNRLFPGIWNPRIDALDAWIMLLAANIWSAIPFTFLLLLAGLQSIPDSLHRAAAVDGAGPWRRLLDIQLPLLTPQLFIAVVLEAADSLKSSFGLVETMTQGGPGGATHLLVYKIYIDGFEAYDLSGAATQSALLMVVVAVITALQFLFIEKCVRYER